MHGKTGRLIAEIAQNTDPNATQNQPKGSIDPYGLVNHCKYICYDNCLKLESY